jgi:RNA polymerase sigma-70 factor (ECF subfamily)
VASGLEQCSDADLVASVADGSRDALAELYRRHAGWLLARLRHRCADDGLVAEALQDTFVALWRGAGSYQGTGDPGGWMWGIAIRRLIGLLRKRHPEPVPYDEHDQPVTGGVEELVLGRTEHGDLAGALGSLSPELRAVVQATVLDGLTTREAARLLDIPPGTVKTRMMRARIELRGALVR